MCVQSISSFCTFLGNNCACCILRRIFVSSQLVNQGARDIQVAKVLEMSFFSLVMKLKFLSYSVLASRNFSFVLSSKVRCDLEVFEVES